MTPPAPHTAETQVVGDLDRLLAEEREQAEAEAAEAQKQAARESRTRKPAPDEETAP